MLLRLLGLLVLGLLKMMRHGHGHDRSHHHGSRSHRCHQQLHTPHGGATVATDNVTATPMARNNSCLTATPTCLNAAIARAIAITTTTTHSYVRWLRYDGYVHVYRYDQRPQPTATTNLRPKTIIMATAMTTATAAASNTIAATSMALNASWLLLCPCD